MRFCGKSFGLTNKEHGYFPLYIFIFFISIFTVVFQFFHFRFIQEGSKNIRGLKASSKPHHKNDLISLKYSDKYAALSSIGPSLDSNLNAKVISSDIFQVLIEKAENHPRKRRMVDLTKDPPNNSMQSLMNTWVNGSFSPVHMHKDYSEAFVVLKGALAFFVFSDDGRSIKCYILNDGTLDSSKANKGGVGKDRAIVVEKGQFHAMTAAPPELGWPGHAVIFEMSGHKFDKTVPTKTLAPFAPVYGDGLDGDPVFFAKLLKLCPTYEP